MPGSGLIPGFISGAVHIQFVIDKAMAWGKVFLFHSSFQQYSLKSVCILNFKLLNLDHLKTVGNVV
jgi:hypothetical protein